MTHGGFKQLKYLFLLPVAVLIVGTVGFMALEKLNFLDALYFTIVTISTVGYGDLTPITEAGKGFSIFLIIFGIGTFLTLLTTLTQWFIQRGQLRLHRHRQNMLIGVFFTEVGNQLLRVFSRFDAHINTIRQDIMVQPEWTSEEFQHLKRHLSGYHYNVDINLLELEPLREYLLKKGDVLVRQLENQDLIENESFSELLWAIVHLRDELVARTTLDDLPKSDLDHIIVDIHRAYSQLTRQWLDYMLYLKNRYPFLFSLALRTNPFVENPSAIVH